MPGEQVVLLGDSEGRLRLLAPTPDVEALTEDDLARVTRFGAALLDAADPGLPLH